MDFWDLSIPGKGRCGVGERRKRKDSLRGGNGREKAWTKGTEVTSFYPLKEIPAGESASVKVLWY